MSCGARRRQVWLSVSPRGWWQCSSGRRKRGWRRSKRRPRNFSPTSGWRSPVSPDTGDRHPWRRNSEAASLIFSILASSFPEEHCHQPRGDTDSQTVRRGLRMTSGPLTDPARRRSTDSSPRPDGRLPVWEALGPIRDHVSPNPPTATRRRLICARRVVTCAPCADDLWSSVSGGGSARCERGGDALRSRSEVDRVADGGCDAVC